MKYLIILIFFVMTVGIFFGISHSQELHKMQLKPTDDAFVLVDLHDITHQHGNFTTTNTGNLKYLQAWYSWNATVHQERAISINYMKFDLTELSGKTISSAFLSLKPIDIQIQNSSQIVLTESPDSDWDESDITFENRPLYDDTDILAFDITKDKPLKWDITNMTRQSSGDELTVAFTFNELKDNTEEKLLLHSKEAVDPQNSPTLDIEYQPL